MVARRRLSTKATAGLDRGPVLTRYLTDRKFIDLVGTSSLYFARLRLFLKNDPDEGRIATSAYLDGSAIIDPPDGMPRDQNAYLEFLKVGPHEQAYLSCWYMGGPDSDQMWDEYVPDGEGVARIPRRCVQVVEVKRPGTLDGIILKRALPSAK